MDAAKSGNSIRTTDELFTSEFYEPITQDTESVVYNELSASCVHADVVGGFLVRVFVGFFFTS